MMHSFRNIRKGATQILCYLVTNENDCKSIAYTFLWFGFQEKLNEMKRRMLNGLITIVLLLGSENKACSNILMIITFIS